MNTWGDSDMMSCTKAFCTIMEHLRLHSEPELQDACHVLEAFKDIFAQTDKVMEDKELARICRRAARLHFSRPAPLATYPWQTIQAVYKEKTGTVLSDYFCCMAYYRVTDRERQAAVRKAERYAGACGTTGGDA